MNNVLHNGYVRYVVIALIFILFILGLGFNYQIESSESGEIQTFTIGLESSPWFFFENRPNGFKYNISPFTLSGLCLILAFILIKILLKYKPPPPEAVRYEESKTNPN